MKTSRDKPAPVEVELTVSDSVARDGLPDIRALHEWANSACSGSEDVTASMQIVSAEEMKILNRDYRGENNPTNVLSFPAQLPGELNVKLLGDLALCADVIHAEAVEQGKKPFAHWAHMVVHGMLHLQGYDHVNKQEAAAMEALEIKIMDKLGFDNPYKLTH